MVRPVKKVKELRELTDDELENKLVDLKDELFRLRFQLATGQLENPLRIREVRRSFARAKTIVREREMVRERGANIELGRIGGVDMAERKQRKTRIGNIVSDKMDKTVVVAVETSVRHPLYGRIVRRTKKYKAHDEQNTCRIGDKVRIMETRPLSKEKRWRVSEILSRAVQLGPLRREDNANDPAADDA